MMNNMEKNNAYNDKLIVRKIIKQSWEMVLKPGTDDEVERASCLGDALYNAAREEMYRELPTERLAAFMDEAGAIQSEDGLLRLAQSEGVPDKWVRIGAWFEPTYAACALGIYTQLYHPELMNEERTKTLAGLLRGSMLRRWTGGYIEHANYQGNLEVFFKAETKRFIEGYPDLCPEFTEFFKHEVEYVREQLACSDVKGYMSSEMSGRIRQLLAWYDGYPNALFVYGTLMRGQTAHDMLKDSVYGGRWLLFNHAMYDLGAYPAIVPEAEESVIGEVWFVSDEMLERIDAYEGSLYKRVPVKLEAWKDSLEAETYCWDSGKVAGKRVPITAQPWHSVDKDSYIWYASYGTNLLESRMACYLQGGLCAQNGKTYPGCTNRSLWTETRTNNYPGNLYFGRSSRSWEEKGVPFFEPLHGQDPRRRGITMKLYRITREQLEEVQKQEGASDDWYGMMYCLELDKDGTPVVTLTSRTVQKENAPCDAILETMYLGMTTCCGRGKTDSVNYLKHSLPAPARRHFMELTRTEKFPVPSRKRG